MYCSLILSLLLLEGTTGVPVEVDATAEASQGTNDVPSSEAYAIDEDHTPMDDFEVSHENITDVRGQGGLRRSNRTRAASTNLAGCPAKIPIVQSGKIVAGRLYNDLGNNMPELACNGGYTTHYAETKNTQTPGYCTLAASIIINPGCKLIVFAEDYFVGSSKTFYGPATIPNPGLSSPFGGCGSPRRPGINSMLWTCKQIYPSCIPIDEWATVTELDNSDSSVSTKFTYEKIVGTEHSVEITESMSVSATVSAEISASFWGATASLGVSRTTGYDWSKTDTNTKSESKSYNVEIIVPAGAKLQIQEVKGTCGGSTIHTQMFKVIDSVNGKMIKAYREKMAKITGLENATNT